MNPANLDALFNYKAEGFDEDKQETKNIVRDILKCKKSI